MTDPMSHGWALTQQPMRPFLCEHRDTGGFGMMTYIPETREWLLVSGPIAPLDAQGLKLMNVYRWSAPRP